MSDIRHRVVSSSSKTPLEHPPHITAENKDDDGNASVSSSSPSEMEGYGGGRFRIGVLDIIRIVMLLILSSCALSYYVTSNSVVWGYRPWFTRLPVLMRYLRGPLLLTPAELSLYNGTNPSLPIYLAVNRTVFDVSANPHMYGPGGGYAFFSGRDATRAFVTGCFADDLTPDLSGVEEMYVPIDDDEEVDKALSNREKKLRREREWREAREMVAKQVRHWEEFFRTHEKYFEVGRVAARGEEGGEKRPLCEPARKKRPSRRKMRERGLKIGDD